MNTKTQSLAEAFPNIAAQWHPTKNKDLTPFDVTPFSGKKAWWFYPYDDPKTGKHFDFEWSSVITSRTNMSDGCPYLSNHAVWPGFNDLETRYPDIAKEWHPTKNGTLKPSEILYGSHKKVWWIHPYDVPDDFPIDHLRGKHFEFEWEAPIVARIQGHACPYLNNHAVWPGFNDLATTHPEIAKEWHPTKNGNLKPIDISAHSNQKVWWLLSYDVPNDYPISHLRGKHFDFEWMSQCNTRTSKNSNCPYLINRLIYSGFNDLETTHPEIAQFWHPTKNGNLKPCDVTYGSEKKIWWLYPYDDIKTGKHFDFEWQAVIFSFAQRQTCPFLSGKYVYTGFNDLSTLYPEIAKEWHPTKNGTLKPSEILYGSGKKIWWQCTNGHEWQASVNKRTSYINNTCPFCNLNSTHKIIPKSIAKYTKHISENYFEYNKDGNNLILTYEQLQNFRK